MELTYLPPSTWILRDPETYCLPILLPPGWEGYAIQRGLTTRVVVPRGFQTDFATVPRWATLFMQSTGKHSRAAVLHDFLYDRGIGTRAVADKVFRLQAKIDGVPTFRRWVMWLAVRIGGGRFWRSRLHGRP